MRKPDSTKKISTPTNPPVKLKPAWNSNTPITATARNPSKSALYFSFSIAPSTEAASYITSRCF